MTTPEIIKKIKQIQVQTSRFATETLVGAWHSAFKGKGMEFNEVRAFIEGDDIRDIDWNVTARMNYPYIKRFNEERDLTVMLVVDVSASSQFSSIKQLKSERIAEIGATLAFSAIKNNDKVGLLLFTDRVEKYIPPRKGVRHVLWVIRELLAFKPQGKKTNITPALSHLNKIHRKSSICFLITDFLCNVSASEVSVIAKKHDLISIVVTDPHELKFPEIGLTKLTDLETGLERLFNSNDKKFQTTFSKKAQERLEQHKKLMQQVGCSFIHIRMDQPYLTELKKFFKLRRIKH